MEKIKRLLPSSWSRRGYEKLRDKKLPIQKENVELDHLTADIFSRIGNYLRPEELAVFALTNKAIHQALGPSVFTTLDPEQRYRLLLYLSKDYHAYLPDIFCHWCQIFHSPKPTTETGGAENQDPIQNFVVVGRTQRKCEAFTDAEPSNPAAMATSVYLPQGVHFNMVRAIMQCHAQGIQDCWLPRDLVPSNNNPIILHTEQGNHKMRISYDVKVSTDGKNLILKTNRLIYLDKRQTAAAVLESVKEVTDWMEKEKEEDTTGATTCHTAGDEVGGRESHHRWLRNQICAHRRWTSTYPETFVNQDYKYAVVSAADRADEWTVQKQPRTRDLQKSVYSCRLCHTDFSSAFLPIPGGRGEGNMLLLTSWKDLGTGVHSVFDEKWQSHLGFSAGDDQQDDRPQQYVRGRWLETDIAEAYEGSREIDYKLSIAPGVLEELVM